MQSVNGLVGVESHASPGQTRGQLGMHRTMRTRACSRNKFVHGPGLRICFPSSAWSSRTCTLPKPISGVTLRNFFYYCSCTIAWIIHLNSAINKYSLFALTSRLRITPKMFAPLRFSTRLGLRAVRYNSTSAPATPPLMAKIRMDLKNAMRAKDTPRY